MFGRPKKAPDKLFMHAEGCRILAADPTAEIQWGELERGHWVAECVCGTEHYHEPRTRPARLDPLDPKTARHLPQCPYVRETEPATLKLLLKVREREDYWLVDCGICESSWQVAFEAAESIEVR